MADKPDLTFVTIERALCDWFDASGFETNLIDGEWCVVDYTDDDSTISVTRLAIAARTALLFATNDEQTHNSVAEPARPASAATAGPDRESKGHGQ